MTDVELVAKKLAEIETYVRELRTLSRPDEISHDVKEERFVAHTLQLAIQGVLDVASHIVSNERLGEPQESRDLIDFLVRDGWVASDQAATLGRMVGFRNLLIHEYTKIDLAIVRDVVEHRLDDLLGFVAAIRRRLAGVGGRRSAGPQVGRIRGS